MECVRDEDLDAGLEILKIIFCRKMDVEREFQSLDGIGINELAIKKNTQ